MALRRVEDLEEKGLLTASVSDLPRHHARSAGLSYNPPQLHGGRSATLSKEAYEILPYQLD